MFKWLKETFWPEVIRAPVEGVVFPPDTSLLQLQGFAPEHFSYGIEILNDRQTSFEFVVQTLQEHLDMTLREARVTAASIHARGGVILRQNSYEQARKLADLIVTSARAAHFPLVCRALAAGHG